MKDKKTKPKLKGKHIRKLHQATKVVRNSVLLLITLTILKGFGGYITNIIALTGDAVGSFSDIIANSAIFIGLYVSQQKASGHFKYGLHRIETLISFCISLLILYLGYHIFSDSIVRLFSTAPTASHGIGVLTAVISIGVSLFAYYYQRKTAEGINSQALLASAYDKRNDALVSLGVLFSVFAEKLNISYVDGVVGLAIAVMILWSGLKNTQESLFYLLDYWDNPEITKKIRAILSKSTIITKVKNIRLRHAGTYIFGEAFLEVNPFTESKDLRDEIHRLNKKVESSVEHLGDLVLYIDPPKPTQVMVALPVCQLDGLNSRIAEEPHAPFHLIFVKLGGGKVRSVTPDEKSFTFQKATELALYLKEKKV
ncbi:hypothetical protein CO046_02355, partial [Candidatus Peregrinibacteria bacterium CG_4_9_14_0_2_um_filter_53_11]